MERRSGKKDPPSTSAEWIKDEEPTKEDLDYFRKNDLAQQFDSVKSIEVEKLSASELNAFVSAKKIVKVITMLVVFVVVLGSTVVSKVNVLNRM